MIKIQLVRVNGRLKGRTVSDRWNLLMLGIISIADQRNQALLKRLRRRYAGEFAFEVVRDASPLSLPSNAEREALGWAVSYEGLAVA